MIKHCTITKCICLLLALMLTNTFIGCSRSNEKNIIKSHSFNTSNSSQNKSESNSLSQSQFEEYISKAQAGQKILLPKGKLWDGSSWNGLDIQLLILGIKSDATITSIIGNHAEIISQEEVTISNASALLVLVDRTQSAAEEAKTGNNIHYFEYWLIQRQLRLYPGRQDMKLVYVLFATFATSPTIARSNILELAKGWKNSGN